MALRYKATITDPTVINRVKEGVWRVSIGGQLNGNVTTHCDTHNTNCFKMPDMVDIKELSLLEPNIMAGIPTSSVSIIECKQCGYHSDTCRCIECNTIKKTNKIKESDIHSRYMDGDFITKDELDKTIQEIGPAIGRILGNIIKGTNKQNAVKVGRTVKTAGKVTKDIGEITYDTTKGIYYVGKLTFKTLRAAKNASRAIKRNINSSPITNARISTLPKIGTGITAAGIFLIPIAALNLSTSEGTGIPHTTIKNKLSDTQSIVIETGEAVNDVVLSVIVGLEDYVDKTKKFTVRVGDLVAGQIKELSFRLEEGTEIIQATLD